MEGHIKQNTEQKIFVLPSTVKSQQYFYVD